MSVKLRTKSRGLQENGFKLDGETPSLDLCPCCFSYNCDPTAMSPQFKRKIHERLRTGRCPACGKPTEFCSCKSTHDAQKAKAIKTHNNKKLRKAEAGIQSREAACRAWALREEQLISCIGEEAFQRVYIALYNHKTPDIPLEEILPSAEACGLTEALLRPCWKA